MTIRVFKWAAAFALAVALLLAASGYRILYSRYQFTEYQPYQEGVVRIPVRNVVTCHYFAGLSFEYAVVPARHTAWC